MIILRPNTPQDKIELLKKVINNFGGVEIQMIQGADTTILGLAGDTTTIDAGAIEVFDFVDRIMKVAEPYKKVNRKFHPESTIVKVGDREIGGKKLAIMAGPCSIESEEQILGVARDVKRSGAGFLRGGAFKPRSSPYAFQGLGLDGLELLKMASRKTGLPIVSEIMSSEHIDKFVEDVDIIQVGARNMQNFILLKELSHIRKPILLKRGISATIEEFLMAAEYLMAGGNDQIILCERGIRTFETYTRNTLDLSAIPIIKRQTHLPIVVDPSHGTGLWWMVESMSKAAIAAGADGLIIEVHNDPQNAKCDGQQSITPDVFAALMKKLALIAQVEDREI